jgi:hypothetical protein
MYFNFRSSYFVILIVSISAVSVLGVVSFLNNVYADNANMIDKMNMKANVTASGNMTGHMTGNMTGHMTGNMTGHMTTTNMVKILSPLQQLKSGTLAKSVQCHEGLILIIKAEDGSPACVHSQNSQTLIARGWGTAP